MPKIQKLLRWVNVLIIFLTFLSYLNPYINPVNFWPVSFFGLMYPWFLLANCLLIIIWLILKKSYFLYSLGCILVGWGAFTSFVGINFHTSPTPKNAIKIVSLNVHALLDIKNRNRFIGKEGISEYMSTLEADVYCFQEFNYRKSRVPELAKYLEQEHQLKYYHFEGGKGLAFWSKYPIEHKEVKYFANRANGYLYLDLKIHNETIRVYNVHLQSNKVSGLTRKVASKGNLQEKETWLDIKGILRRYVRGTQKRVGQAKEIVQHISKSPYPVIVCGDLNDSPQSYIANTFQRDLNDTFKEKGKGLGTTYAGKIPGLRIDYILTSPQIKTLDLEINRCDFSDHHSVTSILALP